MTRFALTLAAAAVITVSSARLARADSSSASGEAAVRVGGSSTPTDVPKQPLGPGFGFRAGVSFLRIYLGAVADYWFGGTEGGLSDYGLTGAFEGGYSFGIGEFVTIRPTVGVGDRDIHTSDPSESSTVFVEPSLTVLFQMSARFFMGADVGVMLVPPRAYDCGFATGCGSTPWGSSVPFHVQVGVRL
jgi:hypothetical protein